MVRFPGTRRGCPNRSFSIAQLQLRIISNHQGIVREGNAGEVLIPLSLPAGRSPLTLEYQS